uniref:HEPN domain-containing protein n=1 Tax=Rhodopseudomonas palustris (strain BisA53) TaxID=316055 RepID=Q07UH7_RHOP5
MTIPNPDHYLSQAEHLITLAPGRQADLRRAISTAYYAVFHAVMRAAADTYIGHGNRKTADYAMAYRHVEHAGLKSACETVKKQPFADQGQPGQFNPDLRAFAGAVVELQARRHAADYDPMLYLYVLDARTAVATARDAVNRFRNLPSDQRLKFLFLLMVKPRGRP